MNSVHFLFAAIFLCCLSTPTRAQQFTDVTTLSQIIHTYNAGDYGAGLSFCDFNGDGWDDLSFTQNGSSPKFFQNTGNGFTAIPAFFSSTGEMKTLCWIDYDNDGDKDIFVTYNEGPNLLYRNNGFFVFTNVTSQVGFPITSYKSGGQSWADYDRDGDLDLYISNYNGPFIGDPDATNYLFRNNGDGTFTDATIEAGVGNGNCYTFQSIWMDVDHNGWPDLIVVNDRIQCANYLYYNNGDGTFTDVSDQNGIGNFFIYSMSATPGDFDNDGDLDLYISNNPAGNLLHQNNGLGIFDEVAIEKNAAVNEMSWGAQLVDTDGDGWEDLYVCSSPFWGEDGQNNFKKNNGDGTFSDGLASSGFLGDIGSSYGSAVGDYDLDGHPDIAVLKGFPSFSTLWRNNNDSTNWLTVVLQGTQSNKDGISSWIEVWDGGQQYTRYTTCGEGYMCQNAFREMFGLGQTEVIDSLKVEWLSGIVDTWYDIPVNQHLHLVEGTGFQAEISSSTGDFLICNGGSLELNAGDWNNVTWSNGSVGQYLETDSLGLYSAEITDQWNNHFLLSEVEVLPAPVPDYIAITENPNCYAESNGSIALEFQAIQIDSCFWNVPNSEGLILTNVTAGEYGFTAYWANNCSVSGSVTLDEPAPLEIGVFANPINCFGETTSAILNVSGGQPEYSFDWGIENPNELHAGDYVVILTDAEGCISATTLSISQPPALEASISAVNPLCYGENGSAAIAITGGSPNYTIDWQGQDPLDLPEGTHTVVVQDSLGCEWIGVFVLSSPLQLEGSIVALNEENGMQNGACSATLSGGSEPYTITWSNGIQGVLAIQNLPAGEYWMNAIDANGCDLHFDFTIENIVGVPLLTSDDFIRMYPVPAIHALNIEIPSTLIGSTMIIEDLVGRQCQKQKITQSKIFLEISELSDGIYFITIDGTTLRNRWLKTSASR